LGFNDPPWKFGQVSDSFFEANFPKILEKGRKIKLLNSIGSPMKNPGFVLVVATSNLAILIVAMSTRGRCYYITMISKQSTYNQHGDNVVISNRRSDLF
jgi:hypothetical protein